MRPSVLGLSLLLLSAGFSHAQSFATGPCPGFHDDGGSGSWLFGHQERVCELRRTTLSLANGQVNVEGVNGGIEVVGEDRRDVALEARVEAQGASQGDAESLLRAVRVLTNGTIRADGPKSSGFFSHNNWSVSYRLHVPRHVNAGMHTVNGPVSVTDIAGALDVGTTNGALSLNRVAGDVKANTVNGGISVALEGDRWHGGGLKAETVNGAISVRAPNAYSAHLNASTVNGAIAVGFPITVQGVIHHNLDTNLGQGGPTLQLETVNGGIAISHGEADAGSREEE